MKTVVLYYSFDGNCALVTELITNVIKADVAEIKLLGKKGQPYKKKKGFARIVQGFSLMLNKNPAIQTLEVDFKTYDLIVVGTPVWGGGPASPLAAFLRGNSFSGKRVALFACHAGGMGTVFERMRALVADNTIVSQIELLNAAKMDRKELEEKVTQWIKTFQQ